MILQGDNIILYIFLLALIIGFITFAVLLGQKDNLLSFDFTIVSTEGTIIKNGENDYSLVISNNDALGDKRMMIFSDRPERKAYYITNSDISQLWDTNKTFGEDPPNAVVVINGFQQSVTLKSFQYSKATDTTTFKIAAVDIPIEEVTIAGPCQIFIDNAQKYSICALAYQFKENLDNNVYNFSKGYLKWRKDYFEIPTMCLSSNIQ